METRYKQEFLQALSFTLQWEGGYSNHPNDIGGATMKGITQRTYNEYRRSKKLPIQSVKELSDEELNYIYYTSYWLTAGCYSLKPALSIVVFDTAVHSGPARAKGILAYHKDANEYLDKREAFLRKIAKGKNRVFLKGWLNRINDLRTYINEL